MSKPKYAFPPGQTSMKVKVWCHCQKAVDNYTYTVSGTTIGGNIVTTGNAGLLGCKKCNGTGWYEKTIKQHWYKTFYRHCPICGNVIQNRVRQYGPPPNDPALRSETKDVYDYCNG